jgi:hypothetical protein
MGKYEIEEKLKGKYDITPILIISFFSGASISSIML